MRLESALAAGLAINGHVLTVTRYTDRIGPMLTHATAQARCSTRTALWIGKLLLGAVLALLPAAALAEALVIDYIISTSAQRTAWVHIVNQFSAANPDIKVVHNAYAQEEYKRNFMDRLQNGKTDLAFW